MNRQKLQIESLDVVSFEVGSAAPSIGTVRAHGLAFPEPMPYNPPPPPPPPGPAYTAGGFACTQPGLCTCPISCDPAGCSYDCIVAAAAPAA